MFSSTSHPFDMGLICATEKHGALCLTSPFGHKILPPVNFPLRRFDVSSLREAHVVFVCASAIFQCLNTGNQSKFLES